MTDDQLDAEIKKNEKIIADLQRKNKYKREFLEHLETMDDNENAEKLLAKL